MRRGIKCCNDVPEAARSDACSGHSTQAKLEDATQYNGLTGTRRYRLTEAGDLPKLLIGHSLPLTYRDTTLFARRRRITKSAAGPYHEKAHARRSSSASILPTNWCAANPNL